MALCGHVLLLILLAHWGPLELFHQLSALVIHTLFFFSFFSRWKKPILHCILSICAFQQHAVPPCMWCLCFILTVTKIKTIFGLRMMFSTHFCCFDLQGRAKDVVWRSWLCRRAVGECDEEPGPWALWVSARPAPPAGHHHEPKCAHGPWSTSEWPHIQS